jgi:hypothetical protein
VHPERVLASTKICGPTTSLRAIEIQLLEAMLGTSRANSDEAPELSGG